MLNSVKRKRWGGGGSAEQCKERKMGGVLNSVKRERWGGGGC